MFAGLKTSSWKECVGGCFLDRCSQAAKLSSILGPGFLTSVWKVLHQTCFKLLCTNNDRVPSNHRQYRKLEEVENICTYWDVNRALKGLVSEQLSCCTGQLTNFLLENTNGEKADWLWEAKEETNEPPSDWNKLPVSSSEMETLCDRINNTTAVCRLLQRKQPFKQIYVQQLKLRPPSVVRRRSRKLRSACDA